MTGNGTALLSTNNPDHNEIKQISSSEPAVRHLGKSCSRNSTRNKGLEPTPLSFPTLLFVLSFLELTLSCSCPVGFTLTSSHPMTKGKKSITIPTSISLSAVLISIGIEPIKLKLRKSIKFFTFYPSVGVNAASSPQVPSLSNNPICFLTSVN